MKLPVTTTRIQVRHFDTDSVGHISSSAYIIYMEVARTELLIEVREKYGSPDFVVVNITADYISETRFGEAVTVVTWCSRIGTKSITLSNITYAGDRVVSRGSVTLAGFDAATRKAVALPADWEPSDFDPPLP